MKSAVIRLVTSHVIVIISGVTCAAQLCGTGLPKDRSNILKLEGEYIRAFKKSDADSLIELWDVGGVSTDSEGVVSRGKSEILSKYKEFRIIQFWENTSLDVRFCGETAIVTGVVKTKTWLHSAPATTRRPFTHVYYRNKDKWLLIASHMTQIVEEDTPTGR
jgi:uncharacterized protein (TIGR02246 family)